ncbi:MAG: LysR family transcriptional regulator, partial [Chromatocurvus sp.]
RGTEDKYTGVADAARLDWNDVSVFLALARHGNLSEAARFLGVNHTTVGRRIRALEDQLSQRLFKRTRLGFLLTDAGHDLLRHAEGMEEHAHSRALEFTSASQAPGGVVRLATMEALGSLDLAPQMAALYRQQPSVRIELVTASHWINLSKREADILISFPKPQGRRISVEKIGEFALHLYATPGYLKAAGVPNTIEDLKQHRLIDYIDELVQISAVRWLSDMIHEPPADFRSTSLVGQYHAAASGLGVAMLPTFVAGRDKRLVRVLADTVVVKRDFWLAVHQDLLHLVRVREVMSFLTGLIENDRAFLLGEK